MQALCWWMTLVMGEKTWSGNNEEGGFCECESRIAVIQRVATPGYVRHPHLVELVSTRLSSAVRNSHSPRRRPSSTTGTIPSAT